MDFSNLIKRCKPSITPSSLKTYNSLLRSIYKNVFGNDDEPDYKNFSRSHQILAWLSNKHFNSRKTYLAALICVVPDEPAYKTQMLEDINSYNHEVSKSEMTDKLENSAISSNEIDDIADKLKHRAELYYKNKMFETKPLMDIQNYVILSLYHGHIVPRRAIDYTEMKFQNYDKDNDNYIDLKKKKFVFNKFKTAKSKGTQVIDIPPALMKILNKWISIIPDGDYLLFNSRFEPLSNVVLNQRLNAIFGGRKAVNALRHYYLTSKYKQLMIQNERLEDDMTAMGSSTEQALNYIKIRDKK